MLTCKVGETIINTFEYKDEDIRKWSNKSILKCPVCGGVMKYKHGKIKIAHFAHESSECLDKYSEGETEEHLKGKILLYEWLKNKEGIQNLKLESWIPETKQRPDIYFELENKKYVIEFQCSPISSEYIERRELYRLAGINDIWILGVSKYNIEINDDSVVHKTRLKSIEKYDYSYLNVDNKIFILTKNSIYKKYKPRHFTLREYNKYSINNVYLDINTKGISINEDKIKEFILKDEQIAERLEMEKRNKEEEELKIYDLVNFLNERYKKVDGTNTFSDYTGYSLYYKYSITYENSYETLVFYIHNNNTDCTREYTYTKPFRGKRGGTGWERCYGHSKVYTLKYDSIDVEIIKNFIIESIVKHLRQNKYPSYYIKEELDE